MAGGKCLGGKSPVRLESGGSRLQPISFHIKSLFVLAHNLHISTSEF